MLGFISIKPYIPILVAKMSILIFVQNKDFLVSKICFTVSYSLVYNYLISSRIFKAVIYLLNEREL